MPLLLAASNTLQSARSNGGGNILDNSNRAASVLLCVLRASSVDTHTAEEQQLWRPTIFRVAAYVGGSEGQVR